MTYKEFAYYRDLKGYKDADVARLAGIGRSTFSDWKSGRSEPKEEKLKKIKTVIGIEVDIDDERILKFLESRRMDNLITSSERTLLEDFRNADEETQKMVLQLLAYSKRKNLKK